VSARVLITGGAGFIGSHLADALIARGDAVRVLDAMLPQVHGDAERPAYLDPEIELDRGDVRDRGAVERALEGVDMVVHLAARVGVGQSMYEVSEYVDTNTRGTAVLLETLSEHPVGRLVVASSMSVYGEGLYRDEDGERHDDAERTLEQLRLGRWEPLDDAGRSLTPVPTSEDKRPSLSSVYALGKYDQECLALMLGGAYGIPTVALRFFNVYGPRQALSNPYTGVLAIFAARLLNRRAPMIFEDGHQRRDFVHVSDVVHGCLRALDAEDVAGAVFNVGSGVSSSVLEIAHRLAETLDEPGLEPEVTGRARVGDIRHCFADITRARVALGYAPAVPLERGLEDLASWLEGQIAVDRVLEASSELAARGLTF
jgi:dTDP-L-rhamnose 4-epimerase